jgi:hypothetical protein
MTALSADARRAKYNADKAIVLNIPVAASTTIYAGALVQWNTSGYAVAAADTASQRTAGLALEGVDNSGGSAGDVSVTVLRNVVAPFAVQAASIALADSGLNATTQDDNTVADAATTTNDILCGLVVGMSGSQALVCVGYGYAHGNA